MARWKARGRQLSQLRRYERISVENVRFERGWITLNANFRAKWVVYQRQLASENQIHWAITRRCLRLAVFSKLERDTLRLLNAIAIPSSVCLLSVCRLSSVTLVHPTQAVELFGDFFHHTIAQGLYFFGAKNH